MIETIIDRWKELDVVSRNALFVVIMALLFGIVRFLLARPRISIGSEKMSLLED